MHTVVNNNNDVISTLPGHAHCQWEALGMFWRSLLFFGNLWEPFGGVYCSLGTFGNLWEPFGGIYCSLGTFGNIYCLGPYAHLITTQLTVQIEFVQVDKSCF